MGLLSKQQKEVKKIQKPKINNNFIENVLINKDINILKMLYYISSLENIEIIGENNLIKTFKLDLIDLGKSINNTKKNILISLDKTQKTTINYYDKENQSIEKIVLIPRSKYYYNKNVIEIDIYNKVFKLIKETIKNYTFINVNKINQLKNVNSVRILPILEMINNFNTQQQKTYNLEELNDLFDTNYKTLKQLETNIIKKIQRELNENNSLSFEYENNYFMINKKGRPSFVSITIKPIYKKNFQTSIFTNFDDIEQQQKELNKIKDFIEYFEQMGKEYNKEIPKNRIMEKYKNFLEYEEKNSNSNYKEYIKIFFLNDWK